MADERRTNSPLPSIVGEETIICLQKAVGDAKNGAGKIIEGFVRGEIKKGDLLYEIGSVPNAIYMLSGGTIKLTNVDGRPESEMPVAQMYAASPTKGSNRPLLGARYFFNRGVCTLAYVAETPCSVYKITSGALNDLHDADREAVILMMYWLVAQSDLSDIFLPIANKALGLEQVSVEDTMGLIRAGEEFRAARGDARMPGLLYKLYKRFVNRRIERAKELGVEPSIVQHAPSVVRST